MSQFTTNSYKQPIAEGHTELEKGTVIENVKFGAKFRISSMYYDKRQDAIMYNMMMLRERFNMFSIAECVVLRNIDRGTMEVLDR